MLSLALLLLSSCDALISRPDHWRVVNDEDKQVFCVAPNYDSPSAQVAVHLTHDGSADRPRYLVAFDPRHPEDETHPVALPPDRQSVIAQFRIEASHWIIDRLVIRDSPGSNMITGGSSDIQLDRLLIEGAHRAGVYVQHSTRTTIRRSVLRDPQLRPGADNRHVYLGPGGEFLTIEDSEFINGAGAFTLGPQSNGNVVIRNNDMYVTEDRYTDCHGNLDPEGECSCSEVHVAFKGVDTLTSTVIVEGNRMWGMRPNDPLCASTGSPGHGIAVGASAKQRVRNVVIRNNVIWDNRTYGIFIANQARRIEIEGNIIHGSRVGIQNTHGGAEVRNNSFAGNVDHYVGSKVGFFGNRLIDDPGGSEVQCFATRRLTGAEEVCLQLGQSGAE